jgi:hypothetical protein
VSNKKFFDAKLDGYSGPFFPEALSRIQKRYGYHPERISDMFLDDVADQLHDGKTHPLPMTSDVDPNNRQNSPWFMSISFVRHERTWQVSFPAPSDTQKRNDTCASRHVAVYVWGNEEVTPAELELVAGEFVDDFDRTYTHMYDISIRQSKAKKKTPPRD